MIFIQLFPYRGDNPLEGAPLSAPAGVEKILRQSCYDCHSNTTVWPWYSRVAPVSWFVVHHVKEGREHLNFSGWNNLSHKDQAEALDEIREQIEEGEMPLSTYVLGHPEAALSPQEKTELLDWAKATGGELHH